MNRKKIWKVFTYKEKPYRCFKIKLTQKDHRLRAGRVFFVTEACYTSISSKQYWVPALCNNGNQDLVEKSSCEILHEGTKRKLSRKSRKKRVISIPINILEVL